MVLGIFVSFLPQMFVIPIVIVGLIYGVTMFYISKKNRFSGEMKFITRNWGVRSAINVSVILTIGLLTANIFSYDVSMENIFNNDLFSDLSILFALIVTESFMLFWFWQHIKSDQNNARVWSANLALYDLGNN
jgi:hypothetical protein